MHEKSIAYFWAHVNKTDTCWVWTGTTSAKGYGRPCINYRRYHAHRLAWEMTGAVIPEGMIVGHVCDMPPCVRNDGEGIYLVNGVAYERRGHLWLGTVDANNADRLAKARYALGDRSPHHRLTEVVVREIKARYAQGGTSHRQLALEYGVSEATIAHALSGRNWGHVAYPVILKASTTATP